MAAVTAAVLLAASVAATAYSAKQSSDAQKKQAQSELDQEYYNASMTELQAEDFKRRANEQATKILTQAANIRSTQQSQIASSGMVLGEGSAQTVLDETTALSTADALTVLYDGAGAYTTSMSQAENARVAGQNNAAAMMQGARATLIAGGASVVNQVAGGFQNNTWQSAYSSITTKK